MAMLLRQAAQRCGPFSALTACAVRGGPIVTTNSWVRPMAALATKQNESFWDKNKRLERPVSPHLTIYKWEITMTMSIAHRTSGILLASGLYGFSYYMLTAPSRFPQYIDTLQAAHLSPGLVFAGKFILAFPLVLHFCSGMRHLAWDIGKGFSNKSVQSSGYTAIAAAVALTGLLASL